MHSSSDRHHSPRHAFGTRAVARLLLVVFSATLPGSPPARADVAGEQVVAGEASIERSGDVTTIHASDGAIIHYDRFSVWRDEELHFVQPHERARVLNRVFGEATHIDGGLYANGIVYIVNPAGIFFGAGAVVDVGGLYAAAGDIADEDFLTGIDRFELAGVVENAGRIEAPSVALLGVAVANHGAIHSPDGTIALVAGERVLLTRLGAHLHVEVEGGAGRDGRPAIEQTGSIDAGRGEVSFTTGDVYSLALNHEGITRGGSISAEAASGLLQVAGTLDARNRGEGGTGGDIALSGERVALRGALLDASGEAGGGTLRVGGDLRGAGPMARAKRVHVDEESALRADAIERGDGGTVVVFADEATAFHGAISARGGASGGDGGLAEISGAVFLWSGGDVDLRAARGETGTLLYDPKDIVISGGVSDGDDAPDGQSDRLEMASFGSVLFAEPDELASPFTIFESEIEGSDANIVLEATNSITAGDAATFTHEASAEGVGVLRIADGRSLTLRTRNDPGDEIDGASAAGIDLGALAIHTGGGAEGSITLETGTGADPDNAGGDIAVGDLVTAGSDGVSGADGGDVTISAGGAGSVSTGAIDAAGGAGSGDVGGAGGTVLVSTADGSISVASADTRGGDGTTAVADAAGGGDAGVISLRAGDADASGDSDVSVAGDLIARGGDASEGAGGRGGPVVVRADGVPTSVVPDPPPDPEPIPNFDPVAGGGALSVANVDSGGGIGSLGGAGGSGGGVTLQSSDGAITAGDLRSAGGAGDGDGGSAGSISVITRDADQGNDNDVAVGALDASGGSGTSGAGGRGGVINVQTQRSFEVVEVGNIENVLQEALGGGDVSVASADASGGSGGTSGGNAGRVTAIARGAANTLQVAGAVTTRGGDGGSVDTSAGGSNDGGRGGSITLQVQDGDLVVAAPLDSSGGDAGDDGVGDDDALGGFGGDIALQTGLVEGDAGSILLQADLDAREGAHGAQAAANREVELGFRDGGDVDLVAAGDIEHGGQLGPHVRTTGDVGLEAQGDIGQLNGALVVEGSDERRIDANGNFLDHDALSVTAGGSADVQVAAGGRFLRSLSAIATDLSADILVTQPGAGAGDVIEMSGDGTEMVVVRVDTTDNEVDALVRLENPDEMAADGALVLATGSVTAGGGFFALGDGDIVVGDAASNAGNRVVSASAVAEPDAMPGDPVVGGSVVLLADAERDGVGAVRDAPGAAVGVIDLLPAGADEAGSLTIGARQGIGIAGEEITIHGGGEVSAINEPLVANPDPDAPDAFVSDPDATSGIHLRNIGSGDLAVVRSSFDPSFAGLVVDGGRGDIAVVNEAGDIVVEGRVETLSSDDAGDPIGGDVDFVVSDPARIVFDTDFALGGVGSGGRQTFDGDVVLARDLALVARGGVVVRGTLDTLDTAETEAGVSASVDGSSRFEGDVGASRALFALELLAVDEDATPDVTFDLASVTTSDFQLYEADAVVSGDVAFSSDTFITFGGSLDAEAGAPSSDVSVDAGVLAEFSGDVGVGEALSGLDVDAALIGFTGAGSQAVVSDGPAGIRLNADGPPDPTNLGAHIGKLRGDLHLESSGGDVIVGDGQRFSVPGRLDLIGQTVRFTDLSALDVAVQATVTEVFARAPGPVLLASGDVVVDGGTDILANSVSFTAAPQVVGAGPAPRIATLSGTASNAGGLRVSRLGAPITPESIVTANEVLDLAIPTPDPGHETPELFGGTVQPPSALQASEDPAAPGPPLAPAEVIAFLTCAPGVAGEPPAACAPVARAPYASALDTERAGEVARGYRWLLGDSKRARAGRAALARAASDPEAVLGGSGTSPAGRAYLAEVARLLARTRMLGLGESYEAVRGELLAALAAGVGEPGLDALRLLGGARAYAMGMAI